MAFLPIDQQNQTNQQAPTGQTMAGSPPPQTGGSAGTGAGAVKTTASGTPTQFGSSASKLGDYLTANAPQIQNQANQVVSGLNQQYGQVSGDINNAANQFGQQVSQGYAAPNQDVVNQAAQNPAGFASDPNNVKAFQGQYNDTYSGPTSYESSQPYGAIQGEVTNAVQNAGLLNTQPGLQSYFSKNAGPNATQASNTLDTLLLQGNPQAQQQIQQAAGQFGNLTNQFGQSTTAADQSVQAAQQAAQQAQQYAQGQFNPVVDQFGNAVTQNYNTAQQAATNYNNQANQAYSQLTPIQQWLQAYQGNSGVNIGNNPLTQYLNQTPVNAPTLANASTPEQYQEAAALSQLLGSGYQSPLDQANAAQAGTYKTPASNSYDLNNIIQQIAGGATTNEYNKLQPGVPGVNTPMQSIVDTKDPAYQQLINELQTLDAGDFSNPTYGGKPVGNPNNYIYGHQG